MAERAKDIFTLRGSREERLHSFFLLLSGLLGWNSVRLRLLERLVECAGTIVVGLLIKSVEGFFSSSKNIYIYNV